MSGKAENLGKGNGPPCPGCGNRRKNKTTDTRHENVEEPLNTQTKRTRLCGKCGHTWKTVEMIAETAKMVLTASERAAKMAQARAEEVKATMQESPEEEIRRGLLEKIRKIERGEK